MLLFDEKGFEKKVQSIFFDCFNVVFNSHFPKGLSTAPADNDDGLITKKEAAKLLSCSTSTIDNYRRSGKLKKYNVGTSVRFKKSEVLELAQ